MDSRQTAEGALSVTITNYKNQEIFLDPSLVVV